MEEFHNQNQQQQQQQSGDGGGESQSQEQGTEQGDGQNQNEDGDQEEEEEGEGESDSEEQQQKEQQQKEREDRAEQILSQVAEQWGNAASAINSADEAFGAGSGTTMSDDFSLGSGEWKDTVSWKEWPGTPVASVGVKSWGDMISSKSKRHPPQGQRPTPKLQAATQVAAARSHPPEKPCAWACLGSARSGPPQSGLEVWCKTWPNSSLL